MPRSHHARTELPSDLPRSFVRLHSAPRRSHRPTGLERRSRESIQLWASARSPMRSPRTERRNRDSHPELPPLRGSALRHTIDPWADAHGEMLPSLRDSFRSSQCDRIGSLRRDKRASWHPDRSESHWRGSLDPPGVAPEVEGISQSPALRLNGVQFADDSGPSQMAGLAGPGVDLLAGQRSRSAAGTCPCAVPGVFPVRWSITFAGDHGRLRSRCGWQSPGSSAGTGQSCHRIPGQRIALMTRL